MNLTPRVIRDYAQTQLWPVPLAAVIASVVLAQLATFLDHQLDGNMPSTLSALLFSGGAPAARSLVGAIAASTMTVTSLTFSLTVVTLQLASSQYSPRLLRTFTSDRFVHNTLALFLATFAFALTVLRTIRDEEGESAKFVPEIAVTLSFLLALSTVVGLVLFLAHLARQLRVERMLMQVRDDFLSMVGEVGKDSEAIQHRLEQPAGALKLQAQSSGFLVQANEPELLKTAERFDAVITLHAPPGDFLVEGTEFAQVWKLGGSPAASWKEEEAEKLEKAITDALTIGFERNSVQDIGFPLQQLLDVAVRALSPGVNDPTTCVHAMGHLAACLSALARQGEGHRVMKDRQRRVRVFLPRRTFSMLLELVVSQICTYGMDDPRVARRLVEMLAETEQIDNAGRHSAAINEQRQRVMRALSASKLDPVDRQRLLEECQAVS